MIEMFFSISFRGECAAALHRYPCKPAIFEATYEAVQS